jgi:tRNA dimethylallyltransferase
VGGEVISADSRQVYKGLDLGTGKIMKKEMRGIPHYLLDVVNAKNRFSVAEYKKLADKKIKEIIARGKIPIICGGTGFYIDAVVNGIIFPEVPQNEKLRKVLDKKGASELFKMLQKLDKNRAKDIDSKNKVRLIRAIEITRALGKVPKLTEATPPYEFIKIGLYLPADVLKKKINRRLLARIKNGMLKEIQDLHEKGLSWKRMEEMGLEYRYVALYLQKKITKEEMLRKLNSEIYKYAKRQMTWFKRDKKIKWFTPNEIKEFSALK